MANLSRTTITLPEDLLRFAKITSATEEKTLSEFIREALRERVAKNRVSATSTLLSLVGSIKPETEAFRRPKDYIRRLRELSNE